MIASVSVVSWTIVHATTNASEEWTGAMIANSQNANLRRATDG